MRSFLAKHQFLVIWIAGLVIIGALTELVIQLNGSFLPSLELINQPAAPVITTPPPPPAPSVTLTIEKNGTKSSLVVRWQNLPGNTAALNIFRGKNDATSTWVLWKTISIPAGQLGDGSAQFVLGKADQGYQYYLQAVSNGGGGGGNSTSTEVLWTSNPGIPGTGGAPTSTNPGPGGGNNNGNTSSTNNQTGNNTSTQNSNNNNSSTSQNNNGTTTSSNGNPYYNPQIQITGYGTGNGDFWVQHVSQSIEIGWQNLPADTDDIILYRSQSQSGPWNQLLQQKNPGSTGSYSFQLVDGTLNVPYYYELTAFQGTSASATYGPVYLPPPGQ
jgi:hypothetical protein